MGIAAQQMSRSVVVLEGVRCLSCGVTYSKPAFGGTVEKNPGCPGCGYLRSIRTPFACSITIREASAARSCSFSSSRDASLSSSSVDMTSLSCPRVERLRDVRADPELLHDQIPVVGLHDLFDVGELVSVKHEETVRARTYLLVLVACQRHGLVALRLKAFADELG